MFEDWKTAWRQAVENFRRELDEADVDTSLVDARMRSMRRELTTVREAFSRLESEIIRARRDAVAERESEEVCRRREGLARDIGDEETVRIAVDFAVRHGERAVVLERKVEVLVAERDLVRRDLDEMEKVVGERAEAVAAGRSPADVIERERQDRDFGRLEREARERVAAERLEELKRRMR
ncbi:MAG: hypothetical protein ACRELX_03180 [Longimicrobiales bacterium]